MSLEVIGAVLLVLVVVFVFSQIWFHFVEGLLRLIKRIFRKKTYFFPKEKVCLFLCLEL